MSKISSPCSSQERCAYEQVIFSLAQWMLLFQTLPDKREKKIIKDQFFQSLYRNSRGEGPILLDFYVLLCIISTFEIILAEIK
jgi:hypothetical protein